MTIASIDHKLLETAMKLTDFKSEKAVVEEALALLISIKQQSKLRNLKGKIKWEGNLNEMRSDNDNG
jgi:Arc/MetJ family transcription regulator